MLGKKEEETKSVLGKVLDWRTNVDKHFMYLGVLVTPHGHIRHENQMKTVSGFAIATL